MQYKHHTFPSGLELCHAPHSGPVVYIGIGIASGTRHERRGEAGIAHFVEHMLFKGTRLRNARHIIQRIEGIGGELNAYTTKEETMLYAIVPQAYTHRALQLLCDIALHSQMPESEIGKERSVILDEIASYEDSPSELIYDEFENLLFRKHPIGHSILGTEHSINRITQQRLLRFYREHYHPSNMVLFVQGDIDFDSLVQSISYYLASYPSGEPQEASPLLPTPDHSPRVLVRLRDTHQRHVILGTYGYSLYDERRLGLSLLVNILGGMAGNARLNIALREERGLVYQVDCAYTPYTDTGVVSIYFGCAPSSMDEALRLVEEELRHLSNEPLSYQELRAAKRQLCGQLAIASDGAEHSFLSMGKSFLRYRRLESYETLCQRIEALTQEELLGIAQDIFCPEHMHRLIYR